MKTVGLSLIVAVMTAMMVALPGCSKIYIIEWTENSGAGSQETDDSGDGTQDDGSGLGTNLVAFHASVESLNMTKSMSPISADTRVLVFAYHGVEHLLAKGKAVLALLKVGNHVDGDFAHLPYFLFKGHLAEPFLYAGLYFRVGRYRRRCLRHACEACSGAQRRSQCNVLKSVHIFICVIV